MGNFRDHYENFHNTVRKDISPSSPDIRREAYERLLDAIREWANKRRMDSNKHSVSMEVDEIYHSDQWYTCEEHHAQDDWFTGSSVYAFGGEKSWNGKAGKIYNAPGYPAWSPGGKGQPGKGDGKFGYKAMPGGKPSSDSGKGGKGFAKGEMGKTGYTSEFRGHCHACGQWGHSIRNCPFGRGYGKGKGYEKGKGKGARE